MVPSNMQTANRHNISMMGTTFNITYKYVGIYSLHGVYRIQRASLVPRLKVPSNGRNIRILSFKRL